MRAILIAGLFLASLGLSACAQNADGSSSNLLSDLGSMFDGDDTSGLTQQQRNLRERERDYADARIAGAVAGALVGGLTCALLDCDVGLTAGAAVAGGAVGYAGTSYLVRKNQRFAASAENLNTDLAGARQESTALSRDLAAARSVLNYHRAEVARLNTRYAAGTVELNAFRAQVDTMRGDLEATEQLRQDGEERVNHLKNTIAGYHQHGFNTSNLWAEHDKQKQAVEELRSIEAEMLEAINGAAPAARTS